MTDHFGNQYPKNRIGTPARTNASGWLAPSERLPLIIAHRGDVRAAPENTIPAFEAALTGGADGIELDVRLTRDGRLVVLHDRTLKRTTNGKGLVDHQTLDEIKSLDAGACSTHRSPVTPRPPWIRCLKRCLRIS